MENEVIQTTQKKIAMVSKTVFAPGLDVKMLRLRLFDTKVKIK